MGNIPRDTPYYVWDISHMMLGPEIERRRLQAGLTMKELSRKAELGETYVRDIVEGRSLNPQASKLAEIARVLGCTLDELRAGAGAEPSEKLAKDAEEFAWLQLWRRMSDPVRAHALTFFQAIIPPRPGATAPAPSSRDDAA